MSDIVERLRNVQDFGHGALTRMHIEAAEEITRLRAALSEAEQRAKDADWQPIKTATMDGTTVLLHAPGWGASNTGWTYGKDDWQDCPYSHRGDASYQPTHWRPIPSPPGLIPSYPHDAEGRE